MIEENVDNFKAQELQIIQMNFPGSPWPFLLLANDPVNKRNKIIKPVGENQVVPINTQNGENLNHFKT